MEFEEYLQDKCFSANSLILDDDMPDFFDTWLEDIGIEKIIYYANEWEKQNEPDVEIMVSQPKAYDSITGADGYWEYQVVTKNITDLEFRTLLSGYKPTRQDEDDYADGIEEYKKGEI